MAVTDKALIASSEFDNSTFIKGIDEMTASLTKLSDAEDKIKSNLTDTNTALKSNRTELKATQDQISSLDKASKTYTEDLAKLNSQQTLLKNQQKDLTATLKTNKAALGEVNTEAAKYKTALAGIGATAKQVSDQSKGRTLFDVAGLNQQVQQITQLGGKLRNVFKGKIDTAELDKFEQSLANTQDEFQQLSQVLDFVKSKIDGLDPQSEEFADLTRIIQTGEQVLGQFGDTVEKTDKKSLSLRGRLAALRTELVNLEDQGLENTERFQELQIEAGRLQDSIGDAQQRIKVLSSDTKNLDFGIGAIRGVASAFGVAEGAAALFGLKQEDVAESLQRLNAIMLILNGLQEIQNLLQKQSVVAIVGQEIATKAAAAAQRIYAFAVGTSVGAMKAFRLALIATGIGAFVVLLGLAAEAMGVFESSTETATDQNKEFTDSLEDTSRTLDIITRSIKTDAAVREEVLKRQGATEKTLADARIKALEDERQELKKTYAQIRADQDAFLNQGLSGDFIDKANQEATQVFNRIMDLDDQIRIDKEKNLTKTVEDNKKALDKQRQLYEAYLERLTNLQRQLRDKLLAADPQDEAAIRETFRNSLADALQDLDKDVKDKKLTRGRATILKNLVKQINDVDLGEALKEFQKNATEAQQELEDALFDIRIRNGQERAELIRDQFTREAAIVRIEARNQATALRREREEIIQGINETRDQGLISPAAAIENISRIEAIYAQLLENLAAQTTRKQEEITARTFEAAQNQLQTVFSSVQLFVSEETTKEIQKVTQKYIDGQLSYENYQKQLSQIALQESTRRIATSLRENEALLQGVQARIAAETDPERLKGLQDQERALRATISDLKRQLVQADAEGVTKDSAEFDAKLQRLATYAQTIGGIINQVVQFWAQANQAEQQSLERSIALQEKRVEAATRLAERGNAEYLRLEEDRLNELQVKQENAARRQLAINAILQTSQALVAFVTALAQGIATGGPLGGLTIAGAVIAAIASGYAIIQSLQTDTQQRLKKGTKSVKRNGEPAGDDTVPAMLTEGEAVIPADTNKAYSPAVSAIYDKQIPAEEMNNFVNSYRVNRRSLPRLDNDRIGEAATIVVTQSGELLAATQEQNKKLSEQSDLLRRVDRRLSTLGISVNVDKNGLAISLMKALEVYAIGKKS